MPTLSAGGAMGRGTKRTGDRRRTGVIHCLLAGGRQSLSPCAVATKLARSLQIGRASNGGLPKRDVNTVSEPDSQIPPDSEGNDENVGDLMQRLQKMMPAHIKPAFKTGEELLARQKEQGRSAPPLSNVKIGR